jgi:uncharacterized membrane protein
MDKWLYRISVALSVLGLLVSIYMTIYKLTHNDVMCIGNGGCSVVNNSSYSAIYGIPVALVGVGGYLSILAVLLLEKRNPTGFLRDNATMILFGITLMGFLFTLYLVYVEVVLLKALCPFCVTSQITMTLIFIVSVVRLVRQPQLQEE